MKNLDQIASEAATRLRRNHTKSALLHNQSIIKSAIEKATEQILIERRAAHASEKLDWMRFRALANDWKAKANEGTWDAGYVNTWLSCADELDRLITEFRAAHASEQEDSAEVTKLKLASLSMTRSPEEQAEIESGIHIGAAHASESANVHIEHYFPKGYDPDKEPWKSIKSFHKSAIKKAEQSGFKRGLTFYDRNQKTGEILLKADERLERGGQSFCDKVDFPWMDHGAAPSRAKATEGKHASEQGLVAALDNICPECGGDLKREVHTNQCPRKPPPPIDNTTSEQVADRLLGDLLAVIHGDGGHYETEHGSEKATKDALTKYHQLLTRLDAAEYALSQRPAPSTASEPLTEAQIIKGYSAQ